MGDAPTLDPDIAEFLAAAPLVPPPWQQTVEKVRARVQAGNRLCSGGPPVLVSDGASEGRDASSIPHRRYAPQADIAATIVYCHGGGWMSGDLGFADEFCRSLADGCRAEVISVDYRLAPEHPFPTPLNDVTDALRNIAATRPDRPLVVAGDSAGGNLAAACVQRVRHEVNLAAQLLIYPVLDQDLDRPSYHDPQRAVMIGRDAMAWFWHQYLDSCQEPPRIEVSPMRDPHPECSPPTVIVTAGFDPLHDEGEAYARLLEESGAVVRHLDEPTLPHGFLRLTGVAPQAVRAAHRIIDAIRAVMSII